MFKPALSSRHKFASVLSPLPSQILCSQVSRGSAIHVFLVYIFLNFVFPARSKALICTKKQNPTGFGRKMTSCKWPFSSYLVASSLLNPSLYFNHNEKFCNYHNFKDAYSFLSSDKILCSLWQLSFLKLGSSYFANVTNQRYWLHKKFCLSHLRAGFQNSRKNHCCRP